MKLAIIDNDQIIRDGLMQLITQTGHEFEAIQTADGVESGFELIQSFRPNLVFLDVEMDDGTGFNLLEKFEELSFEVVFITAHNVYAFDAFKFGAIDFLQKPVEVEELKQTISKVNNQLKQRDLAKQLEIVQQKLAQISSHDQKIVLKDNKSMYFVKINDIVHCEAEGSYTTFFLIDGQKIVVSRSLKEYEELLAPHLFIRTHHSHLINTKHILRIDKTEGGTVVMENKIGVPISQRKWETVIKLLGQ